MNDDTRSFPIQADLSDGRASAIPWWLAEIAYKHYVRMFGNKQTLERMAERGGFGRSELVGLLRQDDYFTAHCLCPADGVYPGCPIHGRRGSQRDTGIDWGRTGNG